MSALSIICISLLIIYLWALAYKLISLDRKIKRIKLELENLTRVVTEQPDDDEVYSVEMSLGKPRSKQDSHYG
jgi:uncharacterized membrane protein